MNEIALCGVALSDCVMFCYICSEDAAHLTGCDKKEAKKKMRKWTTE